MVRKGDKRCSVRGRKTGLYFNVKFMLNVKGRVQRLEKLSLYDRLCRNELSESNIFSIDCPTKIVILFPDQAFTLF